jgi:hypothetical protein
MGKSLLIAGAAMVFASMGSAYAAPGPKILTTGGAAERASSTAGVTLKEVGGVSLITGAARAAPERETPLLGGEPAKTDCGDVIVKVETPYRRLRHLRTQGFYSGKGYASRPYTQGFYSTGR